MILEVIDAARVRLAGLPQERLGVLEEPRLLGIRRAPRVRTVASAWHLGVLLVGDGAVWATGEIVRSRRETRRGFAAESQRRRAELAAAAFRGRIPEGETVHVGWRTIDLTASTEVSAPLAVRDGQPAVRWSSAGGYRALTGYLDEQIDLLRHPPERA